MHFFYRVALLAAFSLIIGTAFLFPATVRAQQPQPQQRVVEEVDIQGNRRLRKDDILYYIQTAPAIPTAAQAFHDQTIFAAFYMSNSRWRRRSFAAAKCYF